MSQVVGLVLLHPVFDHQPGQEAAIHAPGHVVQVYQKGWLLNERLLRPALVVVAKDA